MGLGGTGNDTIVNVGASLALQNATGMNVANVTLSIGGSGANNVGALQNLQGANTWDGPVFLSADTLINTASGSLTLPNYLLGGYNVTKTGSGALYLSGANGAGFLGSIYLQAGTLDASNAGALGMSAGGGTVSVSNGATLQLHGGIAIPPEPMMVAGAGMGGVGALRNTSDSNSLSGPIMMGSTNTQLRVDSGTLTLLGQLSGNGGITKTGSGVLALANTTSDYAGSLSVTSGILIIATFNNLYAAGPLGGGSGSLALATSGATTMEYTGVSTSSNRPVTLASAGVSAIQIDRVAANLTLSGLLSGGGSLQKTGPGSLTLAGSAAYTGTTQVTGGTLAVSTVGSLNGTSAIAIAQGATLEISNSGPSQLSPTTNVALSGGNLVFSANGSVNGGATAGALILSAGQNAISASRSGGTLYTPALQFSGSAPLPATGVTATYSATLPQIQFASPPTLVNGILSGGLFYGTTDFASCTTSTPYTIQPLASYTTGDLGQLSVSGSQNVMPTGTQSPFAVAKAANSLNLSGSLGVTMSGSGSLTLTSGGILANTTGTISGGTLAGSASGSLVVNTAQDFSIASVVANNGGDTALVKTGTGTLLLTGLNSYTGDTFINQGTLQIAPTANLSYGKVIRGYGSLLKSGTTTLTLTGSNALFGSTTIAAGNLCVNGSLPSTSIVNLQSGAVLSGTGTVGGNVVTTGGAISFATTAGNVVGTVTVTSGTLAIGTAGVGNYLSTIGGLILNGSSVLTASPSTAATIVGSVTYASSSNSTYSGAISGSASVLMIAAPAATTLTLSNSVADSFAGTVVQSGILKIANSAALAGSSMTLNGGRLDVNGLNLSFAKLAGSGGTVNTSQSGTYTLTIASPSGSSQYFGSIADGSGTMALLKTGSGTLVLSGSNTFSGGTTVTAGVLEITCTGVLLDGSALTIGSTSAFAPIVPEAEVPPSLSPVPEPSTLLLLLAASFGLPVVVLRLRIGGIHRG